MAAGEASTIFAGTGRAASTIGQSAVSAADHDRALEEWSCEGQCGLADSLARSAGIRHVASHHARAGAAAATRIATIRIAKRFTPFQYMPGAAPIG
ncbi:MAG TPA: hypothetical protein VF491_10845 [Vicinamibacterales bacterium]|jgi:hypothetical protein